MLFYQRSDSRAVIDSITDCWRHRRATFVPVLFSCLAIFLTLDAIAGDALPGELKPWRRYGTPVTVESSDFSRSGQHSLRVVTDNLDTMPGNMEGAARTLGVFKVGDELRISFWYSVGDGLRLVAGIGTTFFMKRRVLPATTDWARADLVFRVPRDGRYAIWLTQFGTPTEFFIDDFKLEVVRRTRLGEANENSLLVIADDSLRLVFCRDTGALAGIENLGTDETYAPVGKRQPLFSLQTLSADGLGYDTVSFKQMRLVDAAVPNPRRAEFEFQGADADIRVAVAVQMTGDGAAVFAARLSNNGKRPVTAFEFPVVQGIRPARDPENLTLAHPYRCGQIVPNAIASTGCQVKWPGRGVMGWMDLSGEHGGIYLATHDKTLTGTQLAARPAPESLFDMSLTREIVVKPGETWEAPPSVLAVHDSDWHASADRYRAWAASWMRPPDAPRWMHEANGWLFMGLQNNIPFHRIPDLYRQAQWMGIEYLVLAGEGIDAMWFDKAGKRRTSALSYPYPNPLLGTPEELVDAISRVHANNGRVMFYFLYERWTPSHSVSDDFGGGRRGDVPKEYHPPPPEFYPDNALVELPGRTPPAAAPFMARRVMCLDAPGWKEWMRRWAVDIYAKEYGADGFYWDVMGRGGPNRCFNARHGHEGQNHWARGCAEVIEKVTREGRAVNPDYSSAIEGASDVLGQWVGYHLMSGGTLTPNLFRYTFPEYLLVDGFSNHTFKLTYPQKARRVFLDGMRFDIHGYDQRVKRIINLRRRVKPFTDWPAVFRDTVGLTVSDERVQARLFRRLDGGNRVMAVTMMNEAGIEDATVAVDVAPIAPVESVFLFRFNGAVEKLTPTADKTLTVPVPADAVSAVVLVGAVAPELAVVPWLEQIMTPGIDGLELTMFFPSGKPAGLAEPEFALPEGFSPESGTETLIPGALLRHSLVDPGRLQGLDRWTKASATIKWDGGEARPWCVLAPPLVNGSFEKIENDRIAYWGGEATPCNENPGQGEWSFRHATRIANSLTPLKPGTKYRFKCMIRRAPEATGWAGAHVVEYLEGREFVRSAALNSSRRGEWEEVEIVFTSHENPRTSAIYLYNYDNDHPAWFDGLELEEIRE